MSNILSVSVGKSLRSQPTATRPAYALNPIGTTIPRSDLRLSSKPTTFGTICLRKDSSRVESWACSQSKNCLVARPRVTSFVAPPVVSSKRAKAKSKHNDSARMSASPAAIVRGSIPIHPAGMVESATKSRSAARSRRFSSAITLSVLGSRRSEPIFSLAVQGGTGLEEQRTRSPAAPRRQSRRGEPATCPSSSWR